MGSIKEINSKERTYYFYNDIVDIETFDSKNLKLDKKKYKDLDIYNLYNDFHDVNIVNPLYLRIDNASGYIDEINKDQYLVFDFRDKNKELLKRYDDIFNGVIDKIKKLDNDSLEYTKDYMKIKLIQMIIYH